jgi:DNA-binding NarL/FixJ family response regulator
MHYLPSSTERPASTDNNTSLCSYSINPCFSILAPEIGENFERIEPQGIEFRGGLVEFTGSETLVLPTVLKQVAALVICGETNPQIGRRLWAAEDTIKTRMVRLFGELRQHAMAQNLEPPNRKRAALLQYFVDSGVLRHTKAMQPTPELLTPRELQVLECTALGFSRKGIGSMLGISPLTVKSHRTHVSDKTNVPGDDCTLAALWVFGQNPALIATKKAAKAGRQ